MGSVLAICPMIYFDNSVWELEAEDVNDLQRKCFVFYIFSDLTSASAGSLPSLCFFVLKVPTQMSSYWTLLLPRYS